MAPGVQAVTLPGRLTEAQGVEAGQAPRMLV